MSATDDGTKEPQEDLKPRRFRVGRRVKTPPAEPYSQQVLREVEQEEDADRGSPEMRRFATQSCSGCFQVTLLFFLIMILSIVVTFAVRK